MHVRTAMAKWLGSMAIALAASLAWGGAIARGGDEAPAAGLRPLRTVDGKSLTLDAPAKGATAVVFYSSECPISNGYSPTLKALAGEFPAARLKLVGLCVDPDLADAEVAQHAKEYELDFPVARDRDGKVARRLGAKVTPEAVVLDDNGRLRYRGRIDDQYAARQKRNATPRTHELRDAIVAVLAGKEVAVPRTEAVGCPLPEPPRAATRPTFAGEVAAILQKNCRDCHRPGQVGPFSLVTYEQARKRADDIAAVAESRTMPPWKPMPGVGPKFQHDRSLSSDEIATLVAWAEAGAPGGDLTRVPTPPSADDGWQLGKPDLVVEPAEDFRIPAQGEDIYRCFVLPTDLPDDVYIAAIEYRPGNRKVVHHVLSYVDVQGEARTKEAETRQEEGKDSLGPGYTCFSGPGIQVHGDLGGWAPGNEPTRLPDGIGRSLPKKADVVMQIHYHPSGRDETDRTRMGLYFCRKPVQQTFHWAAALNRKDLVLPPGSKNVEVRARWTTPCDLRAWAVTPHMHLLGRDIAMNVTYPDGRTRPLVKIADWDFNWQNTYYFAEPLDLPRGTVLEVVSHYDNSRDNPRNPSRDKAELPTVTWGEKTTDEMCIGFLAVTKAGQDLTRGDKDDLREIIAKSYPRNDDKDERTKDRDKGQGGR
ncbi:MAG TPA: redoxin domain-containing protein [Isosphaeraceae bacterium]|jgi:mono/diheme cytochrome c family protein/thiol-disulfide isomerase/thioredoxin|nr:redoxin domain-containing protein [Isosphaeraceae bacterium]